MISPPKLIPSSNSPSEIKEWSEDLLQLLVGFLRIDLGVISTPEAKSEARIVYFDLKQFSWEAKAPPMVLIPSSAALDRDRLPYWACFGLLCKAGLQLSSEWLRPGLSCCLDGSAESRSWSPIKLECCWCTLSRENPSAFFKNSRSDWREEIF